MDVLADVLAATGFKGVLLTQLRSSGSGWGCAIGQLDTAGFHLIAEGACWLRTAEAPPKQLVSGDVVLLPRGKPHQLIGAPDEDALPYAELEAAHPPNRAGVVDLGGNGPVVRVVCGEFHYVGSTDSHPVLSALPEVIHVPHMSADPQLQGVIRILAAETRNGQPGSRAVATRLTEVLFVLTVRAWLERADSADETEPSWLTALRDPRIGTALSLMHEEPHRDWTVESLAHTAAMSRPAFARQFKAVVGLTPLAYLSRVRIDLAARLLRDTGDSVGEIAQAVGYSSEFAFSRAFSREHGIAPGRYRRSALAARS
ncbi:MULTISPECIES: AraC family transcriptional regulator [Streptomyces]|uniref:AraC family transcriptional regulator n=1 Tax=Streptomyces TaxID=1883 RepID=UPI0002E40697|nr:MULTISPECIES: AraC family transcriptional regulator [Streptomyces]